MRLNAIVFCGESQMLSKVFALTPRLFPILCVAVLLTANAFGVENSKKFAVETFDGVPMITVDGSPVRARIFSAIPSDAAPLRATDSWQTLEREFVAPETVNGDGTIHFRFGSAPGIVAVDNFSIIEKGTNIPVAGPCAFESKAEFEAKWGSRHETFQGVAIGSFNIQQNAGHDESSALVVRINDYPKELNPDFVLFHKEELTFKKGKTYVVKFDLRASAVRQLYVSLYRPASPLYVKIASIEKNVFESQIKLAADAGIDFVSFYLPVPFWPEDDGIYDWTLLDKICDSALKANPNALLIPRLPLDASKSWLDKYPEARAIWKNAREDWDGQGWDWASPSSPLYRKVASEALAAAIRHLEDKYGDSIVGYHPVGQNTSEWFTPNTWSEGYAGFSDADRVAFRQWLADKYSDDRALQQAWNDPNITLETAEVPSVEERDASREKPFVESQKLLDFNAYWQGAMTGVILELAKTIRKETNGRKLSFAFYGYSYEFSYVSKGPAASAHYALCDLLESPDIDVICSPISYSDRQLGGGCSCMLNAESVTKAGKLYLYEDDSRTFLAYAAGADVSSTTNLNDSISVLLRNSAQCALRNFGTWLVDLGATGWYDSPELWQASASLEKLDRYFLENPTPYLPEIGVYLGEESMLKISNGKYPGNGISAVRAQFNRLGAPYAQYDLADLLEGRVDAPKLTVILNSEVLDKETCGKILRQAAKTNARVLWGNSSGFTTDDLRKEAAAAGVWIYTDLWCNVCANGPFVLLHAPADGDYTFKAPNGRKTIHDYFTDELLSDEGTYTLPMKLGDTKIFRLEQ
jgi:beta-galactosidase